MNELQNILNDYQSVSLKEMDGVKLQNRTDTKFLCTASQLSDILNKLKDRYQVLEIDGRRIMSYQTVYFDTENFDLYLNHHNGKLNRYKIRVREYNESDIRFLEVKFKNNKGRTLKSRIKRNDTYIQFTSKELEFLNGELPFSPSELKVQLFNTYKRVTLTNQIERVTIDFDMNFNNEAQQFFPFPSLVIIEVKQEKQSINSPVISLLKEYHIRSKGFSKYCIGTNMLFPHLKANAFKEKINHVNNLIIKK